jgi:CDP-diacylglycerol--serine O-phosphatidyltransferase
MIFRNQLEIASYFVFIAAFFDLLDGMVARKVNSDQAFGKELDSLADVISFGFVPGAMMFKLLQAADLNNYFQSENLVRIIQFFPFIITVFSAWRLAKFNLDKRQSTSFIGLPTPANTLFIVSLPLILSQLPGRYDSIILNPYFIFAISILGPYMMISELPLFSMKFKTLDLKDNIFQYILVALSIVLFPLFLFAAIPILIFLYILLSVIQKYTNVNTTK